MRKNLMTTLKCSICGQELEIDVDKSKTTCHSAFDMDNQIAIKPCQNCYEKGQEPLRLFKRLQELVEGK